MGGWGRDQVLDTDRYLESVAPLADDRVIQDEVAGKISAAITSRLRTMTTVGDAIEARIADASRDVVRSDDFSRLWVGANRIGHAELVRLLTGEDRPGVQVSAGRIQLDLTELVDVVRTRLAAAGLAIVTRMPPITLVVDVADADGLTSAQDAVSLLDDLAWWLPVIALVLLAAAVLVAGDRRRTASRTLVGLAFAMVTLRLLIAVGREVAADNVPAAVASRTAVHHYYDHLLRLLERGVLGTAVLATVLLLAVAASFVDVRRRRLPVRRLAPVVAALAAALVVACWGHVLTYVGALLLLVGAVLALVRDGSGSNQAVRT